MKDIKRVVNTAIWDDDLVLEHFSPEDKYFMLYLLTNRYTSQLGIYHLPLIQVSRDLGYTQEAVLVLLDRFENKYGIIKYSKSTNEVAIKNYLRHSIVKGGKPVMDCLLKEEKQVKDKSLVEYVCGHMSNYLDDDTTNNTVKDYISNYINNNNLNINNDNNNDNDNERIVNESSTNRKVSKKAIRNIIPPTVEMVSEYCKERGNGIDAEEFIDFYTSKGWFIGKTKMKDWQSAIRTWERNRNFKPANKIENALPVCEEKPVDYGWDD